MMYLHPYTLQEIELLRAAVERDQHRKPRRRTTSWRRRVRALLRERPELTVFTVDEDEVTSQLAHHGAR
jgi:uncharacterized phage protein gp47/JayE